MKWLTGIITVGTFTILYVLEKKRPLRRSVEDHEVNAVRNLAIASVTGLALTIVENPLTKLLTNFVEERNVGLVKIGKLPKWIETSLAVILMDYTLYLWHVLTHKNPQLWRFHKIHHADLDLTASTAIRFHFIEMLLSVPWRAAQILVIGVSPQTLKIWQTLLFVNIFFHHSNVCLPEELERKLQKLIVTPRLHGIHHSVIQDETDSNWSSGLTVWDRLHKTFRDDVPQDKINIGIPEFDEVGDVTLRKMLTEPI